MADNVDSPEVVALTVELLSAYLANNTVASEDLAGLIRSTRIALAEEAAPKPAEPEAVVHTPAVSVRKSLASADHIISLIDGKQYKTLKRHLSAHGLTPDTYRERYGLPATYPMVAPSFAAVRRKIAEQIGLGGRKKATLAAAPAPTDSTAPKPAKPAARKAKAATPAKPAAASTAKKAAPAKTAPAAPKAKAAPAAKAKAAPAKAPVTTAASANGAAVPAAKPAAEPSKRRGKLGLFKGANGAAAKSAEATTPAPATDTAKPASSGTSPKAPAKRRTARPPSADPA